MKTKKNPFFRYAAAAVLTTVVLAMSSSANAQSWDGGSLTANSWGTAENWVGDVAPSFGTTADLTFNNLTRPDNDLGAARTVRSIAFGADMDGAFTINNRTFTPAGAAAQLTFQADAGNATLSVDAGATGAISIGWNGISGSTVGGGTGLGSNLDIIHNGSGNLIFSRGLTGANGFTKTGTGTMVVSNFPTNNFTGAANFNGGRAIFGNSSAATGDLGTASAINFGGGTLEIQANGFTKTISPNSTVSAASTLAYNNNTGTTTRNLTLNTGSMVLNADLTIQNISTTTTLANAIVISRNLTSTGKIIVETYNNVNSATPDFAIGRVAFGGANASWSGDLVIRQGTAQVFGDSSLGQVNIGTGDIIFGETANAFGAGFLTSAGNTGDKAIANDMIVRTGGFRTLRGASDNRWTYSGNIALEGDLNVHNGLFNTDKTMTFTGNVTGLGGLSFTESGNPSFIRLSGINTYSGATTIGTGVNLNINSATGTAIGDNSAVTFAGAGSILQFNAANETVGSIASAGTDGAINLGAQTLTTGGLNTSTSYGGTISGTGGGLTKVGSGILTLTGSTSFTGTLTLSGGSIKVVSDGLQRNFTGPIVGVGGIAVETTNNITVTGDNFTTDRLRLAGDNSGWSGNLTISKGTVSLSGNAVNAAGTGTITIGTNADAFGAGITFFPNGPDGTTLTYPNPIIVATGGFRGIKGSGFTNHSVTFTGPVTLNGNLTVDHTWDVTNRRITFSNIISGNGGLTIAKTGGNAGTTAVLSADNTYTGPTTVTTGASLAISGSVDSDITVASGARLGGSGETSGDVTFEDGATFFFFTVPTTDPSNYDGFDVGGAVNFAVPANFGIGSLVGGSENEPVRWDEIPAGSYTLIGTTSSTFNSIDNFGSGDPFPVSPGKTAYFENGPGGGLQVVVTATPYAVWSGGAAFGDDANNDGIGNGLAFLLGAGDVNANASSFLPASTESGGALTMTFKMRNLAARGAATLQVQHSSDLGISDLWSTLVTVPDADGTVSGIVFDITAGIPLNDVTATIPAAGNAAGGKLFGRLKSNE